MKFSLPTISHADKNFVGMDGYTQPEDLGAGFARELRNMYVNRGDALSLREGFQGAWTAALTGPLYRVCVASPASGPSSLLISSAGRLYRALETATTPTEILDAGGVPFAATGGGAGFSAVQFGGAIYGVDGSAGGAPFRIDIATWTTTRLAGIVAPGLSVINLEAFAREVDSTSNPVADSLNWFGLGSTVGWPSGGINPNANLNNPTTGFSSSGGGLNSNVAASWMFHGQTERWQTSPTNANITPLAGGAALLLDQPDNAASQDVVSIPTWPVIADYPGRSARIFLVETRVNPNLTTGGPPTYGVRLHARDANGANIATQEQLFTPLADTSSGSAAGTGTNWQLDRAVFSFMGLESDPASLGFEVFSTETMKPVSNGSDASIVFVDSAEVIASSLRLVAIPSDDNSRIRIERTERGTIPVGVTGRYTSGLWIRRVFTAAQNWTGRTELTFGIGWNPAAISGIGAGTFPALRLGFQSVGGAVTWTPPVAYEAGGTSFTASLASIPPATLAALSYVYIQVLEDMPAASDADAWLFDFGPITDPALEPKIPYRYYYSYFAGTVPADPILRVGVESSRSPVSATVTPSDTKRSTRSTIPPGAYPAGTTHVLLWRVGGSYPDGRGRLVAALPVGANASAGGYSWNSTTRVFEDWTSDESLLSVDLYEEGRDTAPVGATSILPSNGRLILAKGSEVFVSWVLSLDPLDGVYFTNAPNPSDPGYQGKGFAFTIDGAGGPGIVGLSTRPSQSYNEYGSVVLIWTARHHFTLSGFDPTTYRVSPGIAEGLFAPDGLAYSERNEAYHIGHRGVFEVQGGAGGSAFFSQPLESLFSSSVAATPAQYALSSLLYHNLRLYLFTHGGEVYARDSRAGGGAMSGWSVLSGPVLGFTGGLSVRGVGDKEVGYFCGMDGMLYRLTGTQDRPTIAGTLAPISWRVRTRRYGQQEGGTRYVTNTKRPKKLHFDVETEGASQNVTWQVSNESGRLRSGNWLTQPGRNSRMIPLEVQLDGAAHDVEFGGLATNRTTLRAIILESVQIGPRR